MVCALWSGLSTLSVYSFNKLDIFAERLKTLLHCTIKCLLDKHFTCAVIYHARQQKHNFFAPVELFVALEICTLGVFAVLSLVYMCCIRLHSLPLQRLPTSPWPHWTGPLVSPPNQTLLWLINTSGRWWM